MNAVIALMLYPSFIISVFSIRNPQSRQSPITYFASSEDGFAIDSIVSFSNKEFSQPTSKNFAYDYFSNLDANFPSNIDGSCGYTAISMLLQYYDIYWNDSIIDENYQSTDVPNITETYSSPGVKDIPVPLSDFLIEEEKYNHDLPTWDFSLWREQRVNDYINANIESGSFLGKLYETSRAAGNLQLHDKTGYFLTGPGVNFGIVKSTLEEYLKDSKVLEVNTKDRKSGAYSSEEIREDIISYLKNGEPVIVGGDVRRQNSEDETFGHVCIAYAYDEKENVIYGNLGWGQDYTYVNLDEFFSPINDYYHLNILATSTHTHNHRYYEPSKGKICSCKLASHEHSYQFCSIDDTYHGDKCFCGDCIDLEKHDFYYTTIHGGAPWKQCSVCNFGTHYYH